MLNVSAVSIDRRRQDADDARRGTHSDHHDLWIDPDDPKHLVHRQRRRRRVSSTAGPAARGVDARRTSRRAQYYHVVTTKHVPYHVCGAQQDGSTVCVPSDTESRRRRARRRWRRWRRWTWRRRRRSTAPAARSPATSRPIRKDPDVFYAGGNNGSFLTRLNRRTGELREVNPYPRMFSGEPSSALVERWQWTFPIIFSPVDPTVLYTSSQHVWKTTNGGTDWDKISRRPHAPRSEDDGAIGRADHRRHERARGLRDGLRARARARRTSTSSGPDRTTAWCT